MGAKVRNDGLSVFVESWVLVHPMTGKKRQGRETGGSLEWALKIIRDKLINKLGVVG